MSMLFLLSLLVGSGVIAQTAAQRAEIIKSYDQAKLSQLALEYSRTFKADFEAAKAYAAANDIPVVIEKEDGGIAILHKVLEDGTLLYTTTHNQDAGITVRADQLYTGGSLNLSVDGEGITLGIWDGGAVRASHELYEGRTVQADGATGLSNHATHVAGTMMGSNVPNGGIYTGMAYAANLQANDFGNDTSEMVAQAAAGLILSNHSYGAGIDTSTPLYFLGQYDGNAANVDNILYNAPHYLAMFSAGNDNGAGINPTDNGYDILTDRGVSKNGITVAAVNELLNYTGPASVVMSSFSSWGPTDDGRIKPDISAKGVAMGSSVATSDTAYGIMQGTSMATPSVTGSLGLLQDLYSNIYGNFMLGATVKGLAIHTALEAGAADGPDYRFGWGLLNVEAAAEVILDEEVHSAIEENTLVTSTTYTKTVTSNGVDPLVVTIVWTDLPGTVQANIEDDTTPRLVNNLNVKLTDGGGNDFFPWRLNAFNPTLAATKGVNNVDNVEKVEINAPAGDYTITVSHSGALTGGSQDYSLIATGIAEDDFTFTPDNITKSFCSTETTFYSFNYTSTASFNGPMTLSASGLPGGAVATFTPAVITADEDFVLEITGVAAGTYNFTVIGTSASHTKQVDLELTLSSGLPLNNPTLNAPINGAMDVFIYPSLQWDADPIAVRYKVEVSKLSNFATTVYDEFVTQNSVSMPGLESNTEYFWRVRPEADCASGGFTTASFTTETISCSALNTATDTPITIDVVPVVIESVITVPAGQNVVIGDINVTMDLTHSWLGDLTISLISPLGTEVVLMNGACDDGVNANVTFDDSGIEFTCGAGDPAVTGIMRAENLLSPFILEESVGDWTLRVIDGFNQDGGSLNGFSIEFCDTAGALSIDDKELTAFDIYPNPAKNYFNFNLGVPQENLKISVYDVNGRLLINKAFEGQDQKQVNTEILSSGMYFVEIQNGNQRGVKKLIIK